MSAETKERPILFSAPMVNAILDGRKTMTRRVVKPQPHPGISGFFSLGEHRFKPKWSLDKDEIEGFDFGPYNECIKCPYGAPGDRLWVRETWFINDYRYIRPIPKTRPADLDDQDDGIANVRYKADEDDPEILAEASWRPSIHMPRWASRITLEVTDVRVERLQDISDRDCKAEGISEVLFRPDDGFPLCYGYMVGQDDHKHGLDARPQQSYQRLWESINGAGSWASNPWVWVVQFKKLEQS